MHIEVMLHLRARMALDRIQRIQRTGFAIDSESIRILAEQLRLRLGNPRTAGVWHGLQGGKIELAGCFSGVVIASRRHGGRLVKGQTLNITGACLNEELDRREVATADRR